MGSPIHIAVDVMGGDQGPRFAVLAAQKYLQLNPSVRITLFGDASQIKPYASGEYDSSRLSVVDAPVVVTMSDQPARALRQKAQSSMAQAVQYCADGNANTCVSSGNTGALMAFGMQKFGLLEGIERPAFCKAIPTLVGRSFMLDLGATMDCTADHLAQYAVLGVAVAKANGVQNPRVGLLNVGVEQNKGGALQKEALSKLESLPVSFKGFVEGSGIYRGDVDVIVCDGFTGNAVLKASEGAAEFMRHGLKECFTGVGGWLLRRPMKRWLTKFDPEQYNGASLIGLNGVLVKSHGNSSQAGFLAALKVAHEQVRAGILEDVKALTNKT